MMLKDPAPRQQPMPSSQAVCAAVPYTPLPLHPHPKNPPPHPQPHSRPQYNQPDVRDAWEAVLALQPAIMAAASAHASNAVRMAQAKLVEHVVLLFTGEAAPSVPGKTQAQGQGGGGG